MFKIIHHCSISVTPDTLKIEQLNDKVLKIDDQLQIDHSSKTNVLKEVKPESESKINLGKTEVVENAEESTRTGNASKTKDSCKIKSVLKSEGIHTSKSGTKTGDATKFGNSSKNISRDLSKKELLKMRGFSKSENSSTSENVPKNENESKTHQVSKNINPTKSEQKLKSNSENASKPEQTSTKTEGSIIMDPLETQDSLKILNTITEEAQEIESERAYYSNERDELKPGIYLKAFCNGLDEALQEYRNEIVKLENEILNNPNFTLGYVLMSVEKYVTLFLALKSMIRTVSVEHIYGCLLMGRLHMYVDCGISLVVNAAQK